MYEKKLTKNKVERFFKISLVLDKNLFLNHTTLNLEVFNMELKLNGKYQKSLICASKRSIPTTIPSFSFLLWEAQQQTQLLTSTPKSNSITNG